MNALYTCVMGFAGALAGWWIFEFVGRFANPGSAWERPGAIVLTAFAIAGLFLRFGLSSPRFLVYAPLIVVLAGVTLFDLRRQIIPHVVTIPGTVAGLLASEWILPAGWRDAVLGAALGAGVLLLATAIETLRKKEIGGGDWKYAAMLGAFAGAQKIAIALLVGAVLGFIGGLVLLAGAPHKPRALGPWLSAGMVASLLWR